MPSGSEQHQPEFGAAERNSLWRVSMFAIAVLSAGAVYLAVTRAEALLLDVARLAGCG